MSKPTRYTYLVTIEHHSEAPWFADVLSIEQYWVDQICRAIKRVLPLDGSVGVKPTRTRNAK